MTKWDVFWDTVYCLTCGIYKLTITTCNSSPIITTKL